MVQPITYLPVDVPSSRGFCNKNKQYKKPDRNCCIKKTSYFHGPVSVELVLACWATFHWPWLIFCPAKDHVCLHLILFARTGKRKHSFITNRPVRTTFIFTVVSAALTRSHTNTGRNSATGPTRWPQRLSGKWSYRKEERSIYKRYFAKKSWPSWTRPRRSSTKIADEKEQNNRHQESPTFLAAAPYFGSHVSRGQMQCSLYLLDRTST